MCLHWRLGIGRVFCGTKRKAVGYSSPQRTEKNILFRYSFSNTDPFTVKNWPTFRSNSLISQWTAIIIKSWHVRIAHDCGPSLIYDPIICVRIFVEFTANRQQNHDSRCVPRDYSCVWAAHHRAPHVMTGVILFVYDCIILLIYESSV